MQAIVFEEFGGPDVLHVKEVAEPHAGPGEIRVAVKAAGVNPMDYKIRHGWMEQAFATPLPAVPGLEIAGVVDEIGAGVTDVAVGDDVLGWSATGAYAQYALAETAVPKPASLGWAEAAAIPVAGETAARVLDELALRDGETLLLHGAAGTVGSVAAQLATARGAIVIGTASPANHEYVRSLGAIPVTYGDGLVERVRSVAPQGVDAVFDAAGKGALPDSIELRGGTTDRIVTIADPAAAELGVAFSSGGTAPERKRAGLAENARLAAEGALRLRIARTFPLAEAAQAQQTSEDGHANGKLVITP
ncbi:NADP-dependent oxidoreductase [Streptomyces scopuliridis]|uniref:NADP-dependent oxidoreductase n=1 Tax=Streptomyces scopuliridis TaxID=452529 RepID=A0ACD4ZKW7_9ACTN|nr:NADP-dependent oxidoreductase [Streptomyces scopuliridis]WSB34358.1 NADP-dependent oxidoreductase [Streptomyces scopuliridis]WSB98628.1 NADP-dependent oxidoreductase [Streptomyces scopuliridis]WSC07669.1 NADP-dependent oxidoreductase [Streptomyces scopuliridis]